MKQGAGYVTIAQNTDSTNYLELAYLQALSIKVTQRKYTNYTVLVDERTRNDMQDKYLKVFDNVIDLLQDDAKDHDWKLANEWQVGKLTPYKETVKIESDIILTTNIDHWWQIMQEREVCICTNIRDWEGKINNTMVYRKLFAENNLLNTYNGFSYFRFGKYSEMFWQYLHYVYQHWDIFRDRILKNCREDIVSTDVAYAVTAMLVGEEHCHLPYTTPSFVHMKGAVNNWHSNLNWQDHLLAQFGNDGVLSFNTQKQMYPVHYFIKDEKFVRQAIQSLERIFQSRT